MAKIKISTDSTADIPKAPIRTRRLFWPGICFMKHIRRQRGS